MRTLCAISLVLALVTPLLGQSQEPSKTMDGKVETIVFVRHGEKPLGGLGQITCKGLNRALALPEILISKFGKADQIYAPDPTGKAHDPAGSFDYVRPLATIEPTAVRLGLPVNCDYRYDHVKDLEAELLKPDHAGQVIFIAWEHNYLNQMAKDLLQQRGGDPKQVPGWPGGEYDRIYVLRIPAGGGSATFAQDHEGLNDVSDDCAGGRQ
jgi:hypothetical protein